MMRTNDFHFFTPIKNGGVERKNGVFDTKFSPSAQQNAG